MNKERMLQLADFIEKLPPHKFEMEYWMGEKTNREDNPNNWYTTTRAGTIEDHRGETVKEYEPFDCGTACCIAGWAAMLQNDLKPMAFFIDDRTVEERGRDWLGLTDEQAQNLFFLGVQTVWTEYVGIFKYHFNIFEEQFENISNVEAAMVLRDIANGITNIDEKYDYHFSKGKLEDLGYYEDDY